MISLMLATSNVREKQILKMAFSQLGVEVTVFEPNYRTYLRMLKLTPDIVLMEIPRVCTDHLHFVKMIRTHKKTKKIPLVGYGNPIDQALLKGIQRVGVADYVRRPLKFTQLVSLMDTRLRAMDKSIKDSRKVEKKDREGDSRLIMDPDTLPTKKIEIMVSHVAGLMAFPFTVARVLKLAEDERSGAVDLAKVIQSDPVISANVLKVSNSVFFSGANRQISGIKDAIVRIGFRETKRVVMGMAVMNLFDDEDRNRGFNKMDFWYHSLATAIVAERIAKRMGKISAEDAFLAGLLHDFGMILLDAFFPEVLAAVLEKTADSGSLFIDNMMALLGITHNDVVQELFAMWKMPRQVTEGVIRQYEYYALREKLDEGGLRVATCVGAANMIAKAMGIGEECDLYVRPVDNWIFREAGMPAGLTDETMESIVGDVGLFRQFLKLEDKAFLKKAEGFEGAEKKRFGFANPPKSLFAAPALYLKRQGAEVCRLSAGDDLTKHDGELDAVVVWAGDKTGAEKIEPFRHLVKRSAEPLPSDAEPDFAPVMVFAKEGFKQGGGEALSDVSLLSQSLDLRLMDRAVVEVLQGRRVDYLAGQTDGVDEQALKEKDVAAN